MKTTIATVWPYKPGLCTSVIFMSLLIFIKRDREQRYALASVDTGNRITLPLCHFSPTIKSRTKVNMKG